MKKFVRVSSLLIALIIVMSLVSCRAPTGRRFERKYLKISEGTGPSNLNFNGKQSQYEKGAVVYRGQLSLEGTDKGSDFLLSIYEVPDNDAVYFGSLMYYDAEINGYANASLYLSKDLDSMVVDDSPGGEVLVYASSEDAQLEEVLKLFDRYISR